MDGPASLHFLRPRDDDAGHPVCLEKFAQLLFHDTALAARRMTHEDTFAIAHDYSGMKDVEILARRCEKNQVTGLKISLEPGRSSFRYVFHATPLWIEPADNIQNALFADCRDGRHRNRHNYAFAHIVADPPRHVVIAPLPSNCA